MSEHTYRWMKRRYHPALRARQAYRRALRDQQRPLARLKRWLCGLLAALIASTAAAQTSDGGFDGPDYAACEEYRDAGLAVELDGGWYLPQRRMDLTKCRLASCQAALAAPPASEVSPGLVLGLVGGGLALVGVAFVVGWLAPRPK